MISSLYKLQMRFRLLCLLVFLREPWHWYVYY